MRRSAEPDDDEAAASVDPGLAWRTLGAGDDQGRRRSGPHRALVAFLLTAVVGLVLVASVSVVLSERVARDDALADAVRTTARLSQHVVAPILTDALNGSRGRYEELQRKLANRLRDRSIESVFIWDSHGRVVFCSDPAEIGAVVPPTSKLLEAIHGGVASDVSQASELKFTGETTGQLLEVYVPIHSNGTALAFETYFDTAQVDKDARRLRDRIVPLAVGGLCLLQLVQIPVMISLAGRAHRQDTESGELMALALAASERERRAIAADVHRGPVPQLPRVTAALDSVRSDLPDEWRPFVDKLAGAVARAGRSLSRFILDLYPPGPGGPDLVAALENLTVPLREAGIEVTIESAPLPKLSLQISAAVYRTAKEALTNVAKHSGATHVRVTLQPAGHLPARAVRLCIVDDGVGFAPDGLDRRSQGHLGLRLVADRVHDAGGKLELGERPGGGASVTAEFPAVSGI